MINKNLIMGDNPGINKIIELLKERIETDYQLKDALEKEDKSIDKCWNYVMFKAKKELSGVSGAVASDVVMGWVVHYFTEDNKVLDDEMGIKKAAKVVLEDQDEEEVIKAPKKIEKVKVAINKPKVEQLTLDLF